MKRRTMLMLMLGLGIASFPQVASAQSVEKSKSEHAKSTSARHPIGPLSPRVRPIVKRNTDHAYLKPLRDIDWVPTGRVRRGLRTVAVKGCPLAAVTAPSIASGLAPARLGMSVPPANNRPGFAQHPPAPHHAMRSLAANATARWFHSAAPP
jgi:hypothetical protein